MTATSSRTTATTHTSSSGVYSFVLPQGTYRVEAVSADGRITNALSSVVLTTPSESTRTYTLSPTSSYSYRYTTKTVSRESSIGNSWGNDIVLALDTVSLDVVGPAYEDGYAPSILPEAGTFSYVNGETVVLRADEFMAMTNECGVVCARRPLVGFAGTGSIPSSGMTNEIAVVLSEDSTITWIYAAAPSHYRVREWELYSGWYIYDALYDDFIDFCGPVRDWWCEANGATILSLPEDASCGDSFVRENVRYRRADSMAEAFGTLKFKLSSVILYDLLYEYDLVDGFYLLDDSSHYAMPREFVVDGDRAYDIVWEYIPTIDLMDSGLPRWWYNRYLQGAEWYNIIGSDSCLPGADPDGDGRNNFRESRDETDPLDPLSCLYPLLINLR